jgi:hypothetical protein
MDKTKQLLVLLLIFLDLSSSQLSTGEQEALLDLANAFTPLPAGWNTVDSSNACSGAWSGITCIGGHVTQLYVLAFFVLVNEFACSNCRQNLSSKNINLSLQYKNTY